MLHEEKRLALELNWIQEFLNRLAGSNVDPRLQGKLDLSGVIQETLVEAHDSRDQLQGRSQEQQAAWLRRSFANNLTDEIRKFRTGSRDVTREQPLNGSTMLSSLGQPMELPAEQSSPSQKAIRREELDLLGAALANLPPEQRKAVELHHLQGRPASEVAELMGKTKSAVAALLYRGLEKLRQLMEDDTRRDQP